MTFRRGCLWTSIAVAVIGAGGACVMFALYPAMLLFLLASGGGGYCGGLTGELCISGGYESADYTPQWAPDGRYIIANAGHSIYKVDWPGGSHQRILQPEENVQRFSPSLSPDGTIAYANYDPTKGTSRLQITDVDGKVPRTVVDGGWATHSALQSHWSPDGSRLLYLRPDETLGGAAVMYSPDKPEIVWQVDYHGSVQSVVWSPDSQKIAFLRQSAPSGHTLFTVNRDGSGETNIADSKTWLSAPGFTDDGALYYASREALGEEWQSILYSVSSDGTDHRMVANLTAAELNMPGSEYPFLTPTPGPDPSVHYASGSAGYKLVDPPRRTTFHYVMGNVYRVKPSPDGAKFLLFARPTYHDNEIVRGKGPNIYLFTLADRSLKRIPVEGRSVRSLASWSPDGKHIAVYDTLACHLSTLTADGFVLRSLLYGLDCY